jgi:hypothetical protein
MDPQAVVECLWLGSLGTVIIAQLHNWATKRKDTAPTACTTLINTMVVVSGNTDFECVRMEPYHGQQSTWFLTNFPGRLRTATRVLDAASNNIISTDRAAMNVMRPVLLGNQELRHLMVFTIHNLTMTSSTDATERKEACARDKDCVCKAILAFWNQQPAHELFRLLIAAENPRSQPVEACNCFFKLLRVQRIDWMAKAADIRPYFTTWVTWPVRNPERISVMRWFIMLIQYQTFQTSLFQPVQIYPLWCSYCHAVNHTQGVCEYMRLSTNPATGWRGPTPGSKLQWFPHNPITHPVYGPPPNKYEGKRVSNASAPDAGTQVPLGWGALAPPP